MILCVEHRDIGVGRGGWGKRHEARAVDHIHFLRHDELPHDRIVTRGSRDQPETAIFALPRRPFDTILASKVPNFVVVGGPFLACEWDRRLRAEL